MPLRAMIAELIDLLDRIDDLDAAQRDIVEMLRLRRDPLPGGPASR
jgi:hypothetical protein